MTIIETTDNRFYAVTETGNPDLAHLYSGILMKRVKGGFAPRGSGRMQLVRKEATKIVFKS